MQGSESEGIPFAVKLSFYELVNRAGFSSTYQEKVYWEVWKIQLKVLTSCSQNSAGVLTVNVYILSCTNGGPLNRIAGTVYYQMPRCHSNFLALERRLVMLLYPSELHRKVQLDGMCGESTCPSTTSRTRFRGFMSAHSAHNDSTTRTDPCMCLQIEMQGASRSKQTLTIYARSFYTMLTARRTIYHPSKQALLVPSPTLLTSLLSALPASTALFCVVSSCMQSLECAAYSMLLITAMVWLCYCICKQNGF
jgi:hypothetical protein